MTEDLPVYSRGMFRGKGNSLASDFSHQGPLGSVDLFLGEILGSGAENYSVTQIKTALAHDLKEILALDDLETMIRAIFHIEQQLDQLAVQLGRDEGDGYSQLPDLSSFFSKLAPLLLRAVLNNSSERSVRGGTPGDIAIFRECKEAVRIALEREIF